MRRSGVSWFFSLALAFVAIGPATAQETAPLARVDLGVLKGTWVRPDGGYTIAIESVGANGQLEAMYFNPSPLPFARAQASQEGAKLCASFELRAGGYAGATYELTYDPATDRLVGSYYQAVAKQNFEIFFARR